MADTQHDPGSAAAGIDLKQFYQVFFEEAAENLEEMERMLLELDVENADDEELNAIFRCAHSVKGGAATFGFSDVAELTHQMEALLDKLRRHELAPSAEMVDTLLKAGDALRAQLARHQGQGDNVVDTTALLQHFAVLLGGGTLGQTSNAAPAPLQSAAGVRSLELTIGPLDDPSVADQVLELFAEIVDLGMIEPLDAGIEADVIASNVANTASR